MNLHQIHAWFKKAKALIQNGKKIHLKQHSLLTFFPLIQQNTHKLQVNPSLQITNTQIGTLPTQDKLPSPIIVQAPAEISKVNKLTK